MSALGLELCDLSRCTVGSYAQFGIAKFDISCGRVWSRNHDELDLGIC